MVIIFSGRDTTIILAVSIGLNSRPPKFQTAHMISGKRSPTGSGKHHPACSPRISLWAIGVKIYHILIRQGRPADQNLRLNRARGIKTIASAGKTSIVSVDGINQNCGITHVGRQAPNPKKRRLLRPPPLIRSVQRNTHNRGIETLKVRGSHFGSAIRKSLHRYWDWREHRP
jgi:hypothetical protein